MVLSVAVTALPMRTSATVQASTGGPDSGAIACREFYAESAVGVGVEADIPLHARACWNGRRAFESYGMNESDCRISSSMLTTITTTRCARTIAADGTLTFTYGADVASSLIPFLHRQVTLRLVLDRNGAVKQFP